MWAQYWAHIIGDHRGWIPKIACLRVNCHLTYFPKFVLESFRHIMYPIVASCLGMLPGQDRDPTKLHQTYMETPASWHP